MFTWFVAACPTPALRPGAVWPSHRNTRTPPLYPRRTRALAPVGVRGRVDPLSGVPGGAAMDDALLTPYARPRPVAGGRIALQSRLGGGATAPTWPTQRARKHSRRRDWTQTHTYVAVGWPLRAAPVALRPAPPRTPPHGWGLPGEPATPSAEPHGGHQRLHLALHAGLEALQSRVGALADLGVNGLETREVRADLGA